MRYLAAGQAVLAAMAGGLNGTAARRAAEHQRRTRAATVEARVLPRLAQDEWDARRPRHRLGEGRRDLDRIADQAGVVVAHRVKGEALVDRPSGSPGAGKAVGFQKTGAPLPFGHSSRPAAWNSPVKRRRGGERSQMACTRSPA